MQQASKPGHAVRVRLGAPRRRRPRRILNALAAPAVPECQRRHDVTRCSRSRRSSRLAATVACAQPRVWNWKSAAAVGDDCRAGGNLQQHRVQGRGLE